MRPPVEQRDVVHIPAQDVELVRADQHARSGVGALAQPTHQTLLGERVETDEGLVQDVDVRRVGEGAGDHEALLLAAGQLLPDSSSGPLVALSLSSTAARASDAAALASRPLRPRSRAPSSTLS